VSNAFKLDLPDEAATLALGSRLGCALEAGLTIWLRGDLGAGKTTLTRGLLRELGFAGRVKSPTYTLVELYDFPRFNLYHFDLYRFVSHNEWEDAGFREYFNPTSVCLVEWPDKGDGLLPDPDVVVKLDFCDGEGVDGRSVRIEGFTEAGKACVARLKSSSSS
jgi:tRNA threonylcarbamoyladenosine biosynthesis protein TsaE